MRNFILTIIATLCLVLASGCGNLSPRNEQDAGENQGQIGEIESMANSNKLELGTLQSQLDMQNNKIENMQYGMANLQSNNENSGVQILSGSGGLIIAIIGIIAAVAIITSYRHSKKQEKVAEILAERIVSWNEPQLEDEVFQAAMYTDVESNVLRLFKKHQSLRNAKS